ncbi:MAG: LysR substrate-binding domain-containing protein [Edaphobacter sp.]|uniref:LysR substrate-binding domain-containing protein n=1 Tax=Edaphobacter sp. TaxID=1934404 RepID=UPI002385DDCA|nr:LysR substrate-binding domain-containing protein [Edaphobacter sp.]MDE1178289.1 LysR substrate-binding domain-containing protein [Edaphobacter sp.]
MELRQIRSFVVLAEELHFGRAAARLHLAQPALSQQIKQLEEFLGTALFERTSRVVSLSEAGAAFLPRARAALRELGEGQEELQSVGAGDTGSVRLGFVSTAAVRVIPETLSRLAKYHPGIRLQLKESDPMSQVQGLLTGDLDIGLMHVGGMHPALEEHLAETSNISLALPAKHPLAKEAKLTLKNLMQETFILPVPTPHHDFHEVIHMVFQSHGFIPKQQQEVTMLQTALPLIAAGAGCALLPDTFEMLKPRGVAFRKLAGVRMNLHIYAVVRRDSTSRLIQNVLGQVIADGVAKR